MRRTILGLLIVMVTVAIVEATDQGKVLLYRGTGQGRVIFDGRTHASAGLVCNDCHLQLFETKKRALITIDDHSDERACFACHNGTRAFKDCSSCHRQVRS